MGDSILELKNLSHSYDGSEISLKNISLTVNKAEKVSILGPSGSGKSTLLRLIAGLEKPYSGTITIQGKVVSDQDHLVAPEKRNVGLVVQNKALFPHLTVEKNIGFGIRKNQEKTKIISDHSDEIENMKKYQDARELSTKKEIQKLQEEVERMGKEETSFHLNIEVF